MANDRDYCVIGLGNFGWAVIRTLNALGKKVIAIDIDSKKTERATEINGTAVTLDATDIAALKEAGVNNINNVVVAIGKNTEAAILTVANLKELKIKNIIVKAINKREKQIFLALGIDNVVLPDAYAGRMVAYKALWGIPVEVYDIDTNYSILSINITNPNTDGLTLKDVFKYSHDNFSPVRIRKHGEKSDKSDLINISPDSVINLNDEILFIANNKYIKDIYEKLTNPGITFNDKDQTVY